MARRPYPFFSSVGFRTANKVRNGVASYFFGWIRLFYGWFFLWILFFVMTKGYEMYLVHESHQPGFTGQVVNQGDWITFGEYVQGTWTHVIVPVSKAIGHFIAYLAN